MPRTHATRSRLRLPNRFIGRKSPIHVPRLPGCGTACSTKEAYAAPRRAQAAFLWLCATEN